MFVSVEQTTAEESHKRNEIGTRTVKVILSDIEVDGVRKEIFRLGVYCNDCLLNSYHANLVCV